MSRLLRTLFHPPPLAAATCCIDICDAAAKKVCSDANKLSCSSGSSACGACKTGFKPSRTNCGGGEGPICTYLPPSVPNSLLPTSLPGTEKWLLRSPAKPRSSVLLLQVLHDLLSLHASVYLCPYIPPFVPPPPHPTLVPSSAGSEALA